MGIFITQQRVESAVFQPQKEKEQAPHEAYSFGGRGGT